MRHQAFFVTLLYAAISFGDCGQDIGQCLRHFKVGDSTLLYYSNESMIEPAKIKRIAVSIHGTGSNSDIFFQKMLEIYKLKNQLDSTLIFAPTFNDDSSKLITDGELVWEKWGWSKGDNSANGSFVSSFTILDRLLDKALDLDLFPNLNQVVINGFSAGGQYVQRYAFASKFDLNYPSIKFRYIVLSPSSYLYLNEYRWGGSEFQIPQQCQKERESDYDYNDYRYGLNKPVEYLKGEDHRALIEAYLRRDVVYIVGALDDATISPGEPPANGTVDPKDAFGLDVTCPAGRQGASIFGSYKQCLPLVQQG